MKWIVVLLILLCLCKGKKKPPKPPTAAGCPKDWIRFRGTDRCFYISGNFDTYENAKKSCESMKSELAPPITCKAHVDLSEVLAEHRRKCSKGQNCEEFWIGIDNMNSGNWKTSRGFVIDKNRICQQWAADFPKDNEGNCIVMSFNESGKKGVWENTNCARQLKYACITCPNNFDYLPEINECLYFNSNPITWDEARHACAKFKKGAQLLTIQDSTKQDAVTRYVKLNVAKFFEPGASECYDYKWLGLGKSFWIGAQTVNPKDCKTPYVWKPMGAPPMPFAYSIWYPGMPNCGFNAENCAIFVIGPPFNYRWEDIRCIESICSICEF